MSVCVGPPDPNEFFALDDHLELCFQRWPSVLVSDLLVRQIVLFLLLLGAFFQLFYDVCNDVMFSILFSFAETFGHFLLRQICH